MGFGCEQKFGQNRVPPQKPLSDLCRRSVELDKSIFKFEIPVPPEVHPLAIFGVVPFPTVLPPADNFPTGETLHSLSNVLDVSFALVLITESVRAHTAAPLLLDTVERGGALTASRFRRRLSAVRWGG